MSRRELPVVVETGPVQDKLMPLKYQCVEILGVYSDPILVEEEPIRWSPSGINALQIDDERVQDGSEVTVFYTAYFPNVIVTHFNAADYTPQV